MRTRFLALILMLALALGVVRADDVLFEIQVDQFPEVELNYVATSQSGSSVVRPDNSGLWGVWKASGPIVRFYPPIEDDTRVPINFFVKNRTSTDLKVQDSYLEVTKSLVDRQPLLSLDYVKGNLACTVRLYSSTFRVDNYGWSSPVSAKVELAFSREAGATLVSTLHTPLVSMPLSATAGFEWSFNLEPALTHFGVNVNKLKAWSTRLDQQTDGKDSGTYQSGMCVGDDAQCLADLKRSGELGALADAVVVKKGQLSTNIAARIVFTWRDGDDVLRTYRAPFSYSIMLGARGTECFPPTAPPVVFPPEPPYESPPRMLVKLELDRRNYRIPVRFTPVVPPQGYRRLQVAFQSLKSSASRFRLVLQTNQGVIKSQEIDLISFVARTKKRWAE